MLPFTWAGMERGTAVALVGRYVAISVGALVLGGGIVAAGVLLAPGGPRGIWNALEATNPSGVYAAVGVTGILLFLLGVLVVALGRVLALQQFVAHTVRAALDEEVARIERDLAREVRGIRRTAEGEDVAGRLDALDREVDRLRAAVGEPHAGPETPSTPSNARSNSRTAADGEEHPADSEQAGQPAADPTNEPTGTDETTDGSR